MSYETIRVWGVLLRLYHWALVISISALAVTGLYINSPWTGTTLEGVAAMPMLAMRNWHFLAACLFSGAVLVRIYLLLFGNRYERLGDLLPVTGRNLRNLFSTLLYYLYLNPNKEERMGHNVLAGMTYLLTLLVALFQVASGFFLRYAESAFWQGLGGAIFGSQQQARFVHHLLMWYFLLFALIHIYLVVWNEVKAPEGIISSIFSGRKFKERQH